MLVPYHKKVDENDKAITPTFDPNLAIVQYDESKQALNFGKGTAAWCLKSIVMNRDLMAARSRIRQRQEDGKSLKQKLMESKKITAGYLFKAGSCRISKTVFDIQKENVVTRNKTEKERARKQKLTYRAMILEAQSVRPLNLDPAKMTCKQLSAILKALKTKDNTALPTNKQTSSSGTTSGRIALLH